MQDTKKENILFSTHYYLKNNSHEMDAYIRNKCEYKLITILFYCFKKYGIRATIDSLPKENGGIVDHLKLIGEYKDQIEILLLSLTTFFTGYPFFRDLLPNEEKELNLKKLKLEVKQLEATENSTEETTITAKDFINLLTQNKEIRYLASDFFSNISKEDRVFQVGFISNQKDEKIISKHNFSQLIVDKPKKITTESENIEIKLISPVLNKNKIKWKGSIDGEMKNFTMKDKNFSKLVKLKVFSFQNGDSIIASIIKTGEVEFDGEWIKQQYIVEKVHYVISSGIRIRVDTPMPTAQEMKTNQESLF